MADINQIYAIATENRDRLNSQQAQLDQIFNNTVEMPTISVHIDDTTISDKTGFKVFGIRAGINNGKYAEFISSAADPITESDVLRFIYKSIT